MKSSLNNMRYFFNKTSFPDKEAIDLNIYITSVIDANIYTKQYAASLVLLQKRLESFSLLYNLELKTNTFNKTILYQFICYLQSDEFKLRYNTVCTYFTKLKTILSSAQADGYPVNPVYQNIILKPEPTNLIYLSEDELYRVYKCEQPTPKSMRVRDAFLIQAYTGLRFSDFSNLQKENINIEKQIIYKKTRKNRTLIKIPVHWMVLEILEKYNFKLPEIPSQVAYNCTLKRVCKRAGLSTKIIEEYQKGSEYMQVIKKKYELVSSHTARRSFATNLYLAGFTLNVIMSYTGHKTTESLLLYINITNEDIFQYAKKNPFFFRPGFTEKGVDITIKKINNTIYIFSKSDQYIIKNSIINNDLEVFQGLERVTF